MKPLLLFPLLFLAVLLSCEQAPQKPFTVKSSFLGDSPDGKAMLYSLESPEGMRVDISNYGGTIVKWLVPGKKDTYTDIVLGYDNLSDYLDSPHYFGAITGRYTNRIGEAYFAIGDTTWQLSTNDGPNQLHGGVKGFDKVLWQAEATAGDTAAILVLSYESPHLDEGFPGNLQVQVTYKLLPAQSLEITFQAQSDRTTLCNLSQNVTFNLAGKGDITAHQLHILADRYTPVDSLLIPTGQLSPVAFTPFDFREFRSIGERIAQAHPQLIYGNGYDHNFVLNKSRDALALAAEVRDPASGRTLELWTTYPGLQLYTGNFLGPRVKGKNGMVYDFRNGFSLTPQYFPDSPHQSGFPQAVLSPGQQYHHTLLYRLQQ